MVLSRCLISPFELEVLLAKDFCREDIHGYVCGGCKKERKAQRQTSLAEWPRILLVHVNRLFEAESSTKLKNPVEFPLEGLDLSAFLEAKKDPPKQTPVYRLNGVVVHYGTGLRGHYVAFCRSEEGDGWLQFNDLKVLEVLASQMLTMAKENVSLLLYEQE